MCCDVFSFFSLFFFFFFVVFILKVANTASYGTLWGHSVSRISRVIGPQASWIISSGISRATSEWEVEKTVVVTDSYTNIDVDTKEIQTVRCHADYGSFILQYNNTNTTILWANSTTPAQVVLALFNAGVSASPEVTFWTGPESNLESSDTPCGSGVYGNQIKVVFVDTFGDQPQMQIFSGDDACEFFISCNHCFSCCCCCCCCCCCRNLFLVFVLFFQYKFVV